MRFALVLALAACSKSEPPTAARPLDAAPAPLPPPPPPPDAAPPADAPAAQPSAPDPTTEAEIEKQAEYMANMLTADDGTASDGTMASGAPFTIAITMGDPADPADAALAKIEAAYRPGLARCFRAAHFTGGPELSLTIAPTGRVTSARLSYADPVADCIETQARNWRFAATERETLLVLQLRVPEVP